MCKARRTLYSAMLFLQVFDNLVPNPVLAIARLHVKMLSNDIKWPIL